MRRREYWSIGEQSLRRAVTKFMVHYHAERNHQSLNNELIMSLPHVGAGEGRIARKQRLGGMLNYYYRMAA